MSHPEFEALVDDSSASGSRQGTHPEDPVLMESTAHYSRPKGPCRIHTAGPAHSQQPTKQTQMESSEQDKKKETTPFGVSSMIT